MTRTSLEVCSNTHGFGFQLSFRRTIHRADEDERHVKSAAWCKQKRITICYECILRKHRTKKIFFSRGIFRASLSLVEEIKFRFLDNIRKRIEIELTKSCNASGHVVCKMRRVCAEMIQHPTRPKLVALKRSLMYFFLVHQMRQNRRKSKKFCSIPNLLQTYCMCGLWK